ncbi:phospho-sugar mutase [Fructobacillus parabroussonetiae]|uniref:phosphoglucomutase (alpha-D-glucose-1,6-bisphosphate-dependent) n=1 Tax=Fructobacillus parabroussonetiae TaxID=2713174 RepID=A0ABS5QWR9_9LACO|nr:phospho-sugar mutase [Fructobacillus parabroussonetiae]MBS9337654.1 phospho-sugar mutase [Fructobacillus parabroussonetiae]
MTYNDTFAKWQAADLPKDLENELQAMPEDQIEEAFYQDMAFGTAGMRGHMGVGPNQINVVTVAKVTEALASYIDQNGQAAKERGVVIAFDSRHHSTEFAIEASQVLSAHGIKVFRFSSLRPTPELSFAVRHLKAFAGIMITASHNPKEDNGYKVYGEDGGQMIPSAVQAVIDARAAIENPFTIQKDASEKNVAIIDDLVDNAYLAEVKTISVDRELIKKEGAALKFVYSPLHGTGQYIGEKALQQAGFTNYTVVKEQAELDGDFPTVKKPNPEDPAALSLAIEYAKREEADLVVATDPDADRMGAAVRLADGSYQVLSGNQIAALMVNYLLTAKKKTNTLPENGAIVTSIVSSRFASEIAKSFGVTTFDVLTGFKYIAAMIDRFEEKKDYTYLFGFEESFGYLIKPFAHDKDAIQALVLFAEMAAYYKEAGRSFADGLDDLYKQFGYFEEKTNAYEFPGVSGHQEMADLMTKFRNEKLETVAGQLVLATQDFASQEQVDRVGSVKKMPQPKANVLKYWLADGSWIALRPSGTEPKLKLYLGVVADSKAAADKKLAAYEKEMAEKLQG